MRISKTVSGLKREQKKNGDFLSTVLNHVFAISKTDKNFSVQEKSKKVDSSIKLIIEKVNKQKKLLENANVIEEDVTRKLKDYDEQNFSMKQRLLEILGSEI